MQSFDTELYVRPMHVSERFLNSHQKISCFTSHVKSWYMSNPKDVHNSSSSKILSFLVDSFNPSSYEPSKFTMGSPRRHVLSARVDLWEVAKGSAGCRPMAQEQVMLLRGWEARCSVPVSRRIFASFNICSFLVWHLSPTQILVGTYVLRYRLLVSLMLWP